MAGTTSYGALLLFAGIIFPFSRTGINFKRTLSKDLSLHDLPLVLNHAALDCAVYGPAHMAISVYNTRFSAHLRDALVSLGAGLDLGWLQTVPDGLQ